MPDFTRFSLDELLEHAWSMLEEACTDRRKPIHLVQVATIGLDGRPKVRTVVLRAVDKPARLIRFHTDARSSKVSELVHTSFIELHAYDAQENVQIRMSGSANILAAPDARALAAWKASRPISRKCYSMEPGPGTPIAVGSAFVFTEEDDEPDLTFDHFRAVIVSLDTLEIVTLQHNANRRARFTFCNDEVESVWLAP